jgi:lipopolysaccharide biosynthesis regulator YciM
MVLFRTLMLLSLCLVSLGARPQAGGDLQAQILYAFHAEDSNQLSSLVQTLSTREQMGGADATLRYHLAHAQYRLGLLTGDARGHNAQRAFAGCVEQLKAVLEQDANSVESLVLQAACYAHLARLEKLEAVLLRAHAADRLARAYALAPRNPRVLLVKAADGLDRAKPGSQESAQAFAELKLAAQIFDATSATTIDVPGWGHAEAYLALGRLLQARGDVLGARNWLEKSLIAAPDFKAAQRQLKTLVVH